MSVHVIKATAAPSTVPTRTGVHYVDTLSKKHYFSVGTSTLADWVEIGTGSGSGASGGDAGINHILRGSADSGIDGWNLYKDAAGALPVDATQGGNLASITFTQNTTSPLRGTADFRLTKPASNVQGEGVSYDFTIARADLGRVQTISFEYEVVSGTFATGDLTVYIIQDTAGTPSVIQPSAFRIEAVGGTTKGRFIGVFQTHASVLNYRLAFHVATTSALAYTLDFDRISVGPQVVQIGTPVTDKQTYPLTISAVTTAPTLGTQVINQATWRRVGDCMEIQFQYRQSSAGSAGSGIYLFSLPAGYQIDGTKLNLTGSTTPFLSNTIVGSGSIAGSGNQFTGYVAAYDATRLFLAAGNDTINPTFFSNTTSQNFGTGAAFYMSFIATVPILGWSSSTQMSNDTDTRVVAAKVTRTVGQSLPNLVTTPIVYDAVEYDSHGTFSTATGTYTVPVSGEYEIQGTYLISAVASGFDANTSLLIDGAQAELTGNAKVGTTGVSLSVPVFFRRTLKAGQTIRIGAYHSGGALSLLGNNTAYGVTSLAIKRLSGPSAIAASETVAARYTSSTGQSLGGSATLAIIDFATRDMDTHGAVTTGAAWKFTAPISGKYLVTAAISPAFSGSASKASRLYRNGVFYCVFDGKTADSFLSAGSTLVSLLAGEYIDFRHIWSGTGSAFLVASGVENHISILRVGNY